MQRARTMEEMGLQQSFDGLRYKCKPHMFQVPYKATINCTINHKENPAKHLS